MRLVSIFSFSFFWLLPSIAFSGIAGGNTALFLPKNADGKPITIRFETKHPGQDRILELLKNSKMPSYLKEEMISDLLSTSVIYSDETIKRRDLENQVQMVLTGRTIKTTKNGNGEEIVETTDTFAAKEANSPMGLTIYAVPLDMKVENAGDTAVAAYTVTKPNKAVVYFTKYVNELEKLGEDHLLTLTLHEQGHRLAALGKHALSEHFVEAWSAAVLHYLKGKLHDDEFLRVLKTNGLYLITDPRMPNESFIASNLFQSKFNALVSPEEIDNTILDEQQRFILQVNEKIFAGMDLLTQNRFQTIILGVASTRAHYEILQSFADKLKTAPTPTPLPLVVHFMKKTESREGRLIQQNIFDSSPFIDIEARWNPYLEKWKSIFSSDLPVKLTGEQILALKEGMPEDLLNFGVSLKAKTEEIKKESEDKYNLLRSAGIAVNARVAEASSVEISQKNETNGYGRITKHGPVTFAIAMKPGEGISTSHIPWEQMTAWITPQILSLYQRDNLITDFHQEILRVYGLEVYFQDDILPDPTGVKKNLEYYIALLKSTPKFFERVALLEKHMIAKSSEIRKVKVTFKLNDSVDTSNSLTWKFEPYQDTLTLVMTLPYNLISNRNLWPNFGSFVTQEVLSTKNLVPEWNESVANTSIPILDLVDRYNARHPAGYFNEAKLREGQIVVLRDARKRNYKSFDDDADKASGWYELYKGAFAANGK